MKIDKKDISIILMLLVVGGIYGFIYETIFYKIDLGYFVKRGTSFGPWIPIYGFGSVIIYLCTRKYKKNPFIVFLICAISSFLLEFLTAYILFNYFDIRLWDYNNEIWNYGNIGGYVCLRSVSFFAISGLLLVYLIEPTLRKIYNKYPNPFTYTSYILSSLFMLDYIINIFI